MEYYHLVPLHGYAYEAVEPLTDETRISREESRLRDLLDIETSTKMLIGAESRYESNTTDIYLKFISYIALSINLKIFFVFIAAINPIDYVYRALNCKIKVLDENDRIAQFILRMTSDSNVSS